MLVRYQRPGISCLMLTTRAAAIRPFVAALLPAIEQLVIVCRDPAGLPAFAPHPRVRLVHCPAGVWREPEAFRRAWAAGVGLCDHQWCLWLLDDETLGPVELRALRDHLPLLGRQAVVVDRSAADGSSTTRLLLWRSAWRTEPVAVEQVALVPQAHAAARSTTRLVGLRVPRLGEVPPPGALVDPVPHLPPPMARPDAPVLIAGMHRSGSAALARVVNLLGFDLGDNLTTMLGHPSNPKGRWQHRGLVAVNQALLQEAAGAMSACAWTVPLAVGPAAVRAQTLAAAEALVAGVPAGRFACKDPHTSLTLRVWSRLLRSPALVYALRDPLAVAHSLHARDQLPLADGLRLWRSYNEILLDAIDETGVPTLVVDYRRLLTTPVNECMRLQRFFGLPQGLEAEAQRRIDEFLDRGLCHHPPSVELAPLLATALGDQGLLGEARALASLYEQLSALAEVPVAGADAEAA